MKQNRRIIAAVLVAMTAFAATGCLTRDRGVHRGEPVEKHQPMKKPPVPHK